MRILHENPDLRRETAFFCSFCALEVCYCFQHAAFWHGVNSNTGNDLLVPVLDSQYNSIFEFEI